MVDSSARAGEAFVFRLGAGQAIPGWEEGIPGMRPGGRRRLVVPPELAFGDDGLADRIPPRATLEFVVVLVGVPESSS